MRVRRWSTIARAIIPACAMSAALACGAADPAPAPDAASDPAADARARGTVVLTDEAIKNGGIVVAPVRATMRADRIAAAGRLTVDDTRTVRVGALQEGLILDTAAQVGDRVAARQLLATLHSHALHDAWAGYRKALADERRVERQLSFAVDAHERAERLYADKAMAQQDVQRAAVERNSTAEMLEAAKAEVARSIEELEHVGVTVSEDGPTPTAEATAAAAGAASERVPIRTPTGGVVLERLVTPGTTVTVGTPLFVVSDLSALWAIAEVDESHLSRVKTGGSVDVSVAAYPGEVFRGTITFVADTINPVTRRVTIRSAVANADRRLKPEMLATMSLGEGAPRPALVVPTGAVQTVDGALTVFVEEARGRFVARQVQTGTEADGLVEITSGLKEGERVVAAGSFVLKSELGKEPESGN